MTYFSEIRKKDGINLDLVQPKFSLIAKSFLCLVCKKLVISPVCCENCQEFYCKDCLSAFLKSKIKNEKRCIGRIYGTNKGCYSNLKTTADLVVKREKKVLDDIEIRCEYEGCNEVLKYQYYFDHIEACKFKSFKCNECNYVSTQENLVKHVDECGEIEVECEECHQAMKRKIMEEHTEICEERLVDCNMCKGSFKFKEIERHNGYKCFWDIYNFTKENFPKVQKFDKLLNKKRRLEEMIEKFSHRREKKIKKRNKKVKLCKVSLKKSQQNCNNLKLDVKKHKKIFKIDKNNINKISKINERTQRMTENNLTKEKQMELNPIEYFFCGGNNEEKHNIKWVNNSTIYTNSDLNVFTMCSLNELPENFSVTIRLNKIIHKEKGILTAIGFSSKPVCEENYIIGKTNRTEWAILQDGLILENDDFKNDLYHYEFKFKDGDEITFTYYDKHINFYINNIPYEYSWYFSCKHMFLIATICRGEEIEILDKNIVTKFN